MLNQRVRSQANEIGLYVNFLITSEGAVPAAPGTLVYPRCQSPGDPANKTEVAKFALKSMQCLPFSKVVLNLQYDGEKGTHAEDLIQYAKGCFPSAEVLARTSRPSTVEAWKVDTEDVAAWFGEETPIVCVYNHDHVFVDRDASSFLGSIEEVFRDSDGAPRYLVYSHTPECLAMIASIRGTELAVRNAFNMDLRCGDVVQVGAYTYKLPIHGHIPSFFVTTAEGLRRIWESASPAGEYVPRPEWHGLEFPGVSFDLYLPTREYFRHFDGYGHVTTLGQGMALGFTGFPGAMARAREHTNVFLAEVLNPTSSATIEVLEESYYRIFCDNYLLGIRNALILAISEGRFFRARDHFTQAFQRFVNAYLRVGIDVSVEVCDEIKLRLLHRIMSRANELQSLILADALVYGIQIAGAIPKQVDKDLDDRGVGRTIQQRLRRAGGRLKRMLRAMLSEN